MRNWLMILGLLAAVMLAACEQREPEVAVQPAEREGQVAGEPARQPATTEQERAAQPAVGEQKPEQEVAGQGTTTPPPSDTMSRPDAAQEPAVAQPGAQPDSEFFGQSPQFGNAPETIVLKASNGNVTLSHKKHAGLMDCKTCHGDGTPGSIEGFSKDQAHALCTGCHKEKGAGPTKCQDCHKKQ